MNHNLLLLSCTLLLSSCCTIGTTEQTKLYPFCLDEEQCGYLDSNGKIHIKPIFESVSGEFSNGLSSVSLDGKTGFIDMAGNWKIKPKFLHAENFGDNDFSDNLALVQSEDNNKFGYIDLQGDILIPLQFDQGFSDATQAKTKEIFSAEKNGLKGYVNSIGKWVVEPIYQHASNFPKEGPASVKKDGKWGFMDQSGKIVVPLEYEDVHGFWGGGPAIGKKFSGMYGFIDKSGKFTELPEIDSTYGFGYTHNLTRVKIDDKYGFINREGDLVIDAIYEDVGFFKDGLARVKIGSSYEHGGKSGYIDMEGKVVMPIEYDLNLRTAGFERPTHFASNGLIVAKKASEPGQMNTYGYIDKFGKWIIEPEYLSAYRFNSLGLAKVVSATDKPNKWNPGFINANNERLINVNLITEDYGNVKDDFFVVQDQVGDEFLNGVFDKHGNEVVPIEFDHIGLREGFILGSMYSGKETPFTYQGVRIEPQ